MSLLPLANYPLNAEAAAANVGSTLASTTKPVPGAGAGKKNDEPGVVAEARANIPMSGVLRGHISTWKFDSPGKFRSYVGSVTTTATINHLPDVVDTCVTVRIGARSLDPMGEVKKHARAPRDTVPMALPFTPNPAYTQQLASFARKYTNFVSTFDRADYAGVIYRLSQYVAAYTVCGELTWDQAMCGVQLAIRSLAVADAPSGVTEGVLFVPRSLDTFKNDAVFAAIVAAQNSMGGVVVTDVVAVSADQNAPRINAYSGYALAMGSWDAIRILIAIMSKSGAGAIGAYALVCGLHSVLTVAGHTDEGAVTRAVLRRAAFRPGFGGVYNEDVGSYIGLPAPSPHHPETLVCAVDSVLAYSAGLVANCDPCVTVSGRILPTLLSARSVSYEDRSRVAPTDAIQREMAESLAEVAPAFTALYTKQLGKGMLAGEEGADLAAAHMNWCYGSYAVSGGSRHSRYTVLAPFFWIEPTVLFNSVDPTLPAYAAGHGSLCTTASASTLPYAPKVQVYRKTKLVTTAYVDYRSARTTGFAVHHGLSPRNGLAAIKLIRASFADFALRGGPDESVATSAIAGRSFSEYLWRRGDGGIPAPCEFLYTQGAVVLNFLHAAYDPAENRFNLAGIKQEEELEANEVITVRASAPHFVGMLALNENVRSVQRAKTNAAKALDIARRGMLGGFPAGGDFLTVSDSAVIMPSGEVVSPASAASQATGTSEAAPAPTTAQGPPAAKTALMAPARTQPPGPGASISPLPSHPTVSGSASTASAGTTDSAGALPPGADTTGAAPAAGASGDTPTPPLC